MATALLSGCTGCFNLLALRPELRAPAQHQDALALADALEKLIDEGAATPKDRENAYQAIKQWEQPTAEYAYARAQLAGRLAQVRGLTAVFLINEMEHYGRMSMKLDPKWRDGAARRLLGTLYVLAPANLLKHGNSEEGIDLLEKQVEAYPNDPVNHLRLAEGYITLNDPDPAIEHLCYAQARQEALRPSERKLLATLVEQAGGKGKLTCGAKPEAKPESE